MKIAIIGAGWVGCHLTKVLKDTHQVYLYEALGVFELASSHNQNRLHQGFHYPRNYRTRILCKDTFKKFIEEYGDFLVEIPKNVYAVARESNIDLVTYKSILHADRIPFTDTNLSEVVGIEGAIITGEMYIDSAKVQNYFKELVKDNIVYKQVENINMLAQEYDLVINCTNNYIKDTSTDSYYELTVSLVYEKVNSSLEFDALTIVDGNFFSIYPYIGDLYTVTDVEYTPMYRGASIDELLHKEKTLTSKSIKNTRTLIENKISSTYPNFLKNFKYSSYFTAIKTKTHNQTADRYPIIAVADRKIINCFTGKIQGIYKIAESIENYIHENINR